MIYDTEDKHVIPIKDLKDYNLGLFNLAERVSLERQRRFFAENKDLLLFGLEPERMSSIELTDRYLDKSGESRPSIDVLFSPKNSADERVRPWLNFCMLGKHIAVSGGPIILLNDDCIYEDSTHCAPEYWHWKPDEPDYIRELLKTMRSDSRFASGELAVEQVVLLLKQGEHIKPKSTYLPDIGFVARYVLYPLGESSYASEIAENALPAAKERYINPGIKPPSEIKGIGSQKSRKRGPLKVIVDLFTAEMMG